MSENHYIATFYSHFGAVRFKRTLEKNRIPAKVMPVPRSLSSSCGTCVSFTAADYPKDDLHGEVEQIAIVLPDGYETVYRAENS